MLQEKRSSAQTLQVIEAAPEHYNVLADFYNQNIKTHRHLDWFSTLDWIGSHPYLIETRGEEIQAALCAAPENEDSAWIRVFGARKSIDETACWDRLLPVAVENLRENGVQRVAALALHPWFNTLLKKSGFRNRQNIIVLEWQGKFPPKIPLNPEILLRPMHADDLPIVEAIDRSAFPSLWQNALAGLTKAFHQPGISTVAVKGETIVGYQISTAMTIYGHLARLAVEPKEQHQGIAYALVYDLLKQFEHRGFWRVTVNTQSDNKASLRLYQKFGFVRTKEEIKVYELQL
jgi:ribosomal protein S18 acetylase RimI-like enzyme